MKNQVKQYNLWADIFIEEKREWRKCVGTSGSCKEKVFGFRVDKFCAPCLTVKDNLENPWKMAAVREEAKAEEEHLRKRRRTRQEYRERKKIQDCSSLDKRIALP